MLFPRHITDAAVPAPVLSVAIILASVMLTSCRAEPPKPKRTTVVDAVAVHKADVPVMINAIGTVEPVQKVEIKPQISGVIQEVHFAEGDAVEVGQVLFKLDRRPFDAVRAQVAAQLKTANIAADAAERNLDRGRPLFERKIISEGEFDGLTAAADAADAAVEVQKAALRAAVLNVEYTTIRAPIPGRAGRLLAYPGDVVTANTTSMVQINQTRPINVRFTVPEKDIATVRAAATAGEVEVTATPGTDSGRQATGSLTFVDNEVDSGTGSLALKAVFDNADEWLWPGQFVQVGARIGMLKDVLVVPAHAVQTGQTGPFAFVVEDGKAIFRRVGTGRLYDGMVVVTEGLADGDIVVTDGQLKLTDGSSVEVRARGNADAATAETDGEAR